MNINGFNRLESNTVIFRDEENNAFTVANALSMIDLFLTFMRATFNTNTEPFSTAVKVAKHAGEILSNKPTINIITKKMLKYL